MEERSLNYYASSSANNFPNPNNISYFAHQAIRAGYASPELMRREYHRNPSMNLDFRESIQRELEKERIRAEIIAEEVVRRKLLEDEVRRELMMERELAMRRGGGGGGVRELAIGSTIRFQHRENFNRGVGVGVPLLTNFKHRVGVSPHREIRFCESGTLPFQRDPVVARSGSGISSGVKLKEIKETKDNVVMLAKPKATDLKRKATTPPLVAPADQSTGSKKPKTKEEWSCALCRVTATSEQALNDHLQGKKHKSRENGLNSQRTGFGTGPLPKMGNHIVAKPIKVPGTSNNSSVNKDGVRAGESSSAKVESISQKILAIDQKSALKNETKTSIAKGKNKEASQKSTSAKPKKKFRHFCEVCQIGTYSLKVMNAHKKGKRHLAKAKKPNKTPENSAPKTKTNIKEKKVIEEPIVCSSSEKDVVEEKEMDNNVANNSLEKGVDEENNGTDASIPQETNIGSSEIEVKRNVSGEEHNDKVLEIDGDFVSIDKE